MTRREWLGDLGQDQAGGTGGGAAGVTADDAGSTEPIRVHVVETARLAGPIAAGQVSNLAVQTTTLILLGSFYPEALAAGGLALRFTVMTNILSSITLAVGVSVAVAQGAGDLRRLSPLYWNGLYLTLALSALSFAWLSAAPLTLGVLGQPPELIEETRSALEIMRWAEPANLLRFGLMRGILPAFGLARIQYVLTPVSIAIYVAAARVLATGFGIAPAQGWLGIPIALVITSWIAALVLLGLVHGTRHRRRVPLASPSLRHLAELLRLGLPIGIFTAIDGLFFFATTILVGRLGAATLAAHQIVMSFGSIAAVAAASCGDAAAVRIGFRRGRRAWTDARVAGFVAIAMSVTMTTATAIAIAIWPNVFIGLFISVHAPENQAIVRVAQSLILFSSLFVLVEGFYGAGTGTLRGLDDIRFPMLLAPVVYWGIGLPVGYGLSSLLQLGAAGLWCGMVTSLSLSALVLVGRYVWRSRRPSLPAAVGVPTRRCEPPLVPTLSGGDLA
jgi:multidrug resistance protein, MATE family